MTRLDALKLATKDAIKLMYGATLFLLIAAFIEAFWSSGTYFSRDIKYIVGIFLWLFVLTYLLYPRKPVYET